MQGSRPTALDGSSGVQVVETTSLAVSPPVIILAPLYLALLYFACLEKTQVALVEKVGLPRHRSFVCPSTWKPARKGRSHKCRDIRIRLLFLAILFCDYPINFGNMLRCKLLTDLLNAHAVEVIASDHSLANIEEPVRFHLHRYWSHITRRAGRPHQFPPIFTNTAHEGSGRELPAGFGRMVPADSKYTYLEVLIKTSPPYWRSWLPSS
uniref:(California timema) hypothetical protein n=1 Tax=Timema californicum TaxID=61474 RepID=A0A7R9JIB4_TIMCA|nr:unnamed protein product [Timema californicum]